MVNDVLQQRLQAWRARLQNLSDLLVPTDYPRPLPPQTVEEVETLELSEQTLLSILQLSLKMPGAHGSDQHPTPFSILLTAFAVLLQRYTGDEEFAVGSSSPSNNAHVLKLSVDPLHTFEQVLSMVQKVVYFGKKAGKEVCILTSVALWLW